MNPHDINRMTGEDIAQMGFTPVPKTLTSPVTGAIRTDVLMNEPVEGEALILRRYTENWAAPDDRKVNPWDLNELDPTDSGTMGTIPGATIECNVGDDVIVYFRNMDSRPGKRVEERTHSLHPHGIVFAPEYDGAYPLSPPDLTQPVGPEDPLWTALGVTGGFKMGDRVPPCGTFTYRWNTFEWPSTAGVWLYHDHSICDHHNVRLGAIGTLVIHNEADENDVIVQDLPGGQPNGRLTKWCFHPFLLKELRVSPTDLQRVSPTILDEIDADLAMDSPHRAKKKTEDRHPHLDRLFTFEGNPIELALENRVITAFFPPLLYCSSQTGVIPPALSRDGHGAPWKHHGHQWTDLARKHTDTDWRTRNEDEIRTRRDERRYVPHLPPACSPLGCSRALRQQSRRRAWRGSGKSS